MRSGGGWYRHRAELLFCALLLLHLPPEGAFGQERSPLPGERIRIRLSEQPHAIEGAAHPQLLRGTFIGFRADTLLLRVHPAAGITAIARRGIERFEVSRGVRSRLESAALNGAGFAFLGSLERVLFASIDSDRYEEELWQSALIGAAGGALIGVAVGALRPQERWERLRRWRDE